MSSTSPWEAYTLPYTTKIDNTTKKSVNLKYWYGRLGNNFIQIRTALRIAICCKAELHIEEPHNGLPLLKRHFDFSNLKEGELVVGLKKSSGCEDIQVHWGSGFYYYYGVHTEPKQAGEPKNLIDSKLPFSIDNSCSYDNYALLNWVIFDVNSLDERFEDENNKKAMGRTCPKYLKHKALVIHIRSGDIFSNNRTFAPPHTIMHYKQLPLVFYQNIIRSRPWNTITFVSERTFPEQTSPEQLMNPIWLYYHDKKNRRKNMIFPVESDFETDLLLMACSRYFVSAVSSLNKFIVYFNPSLKELFTYQMCYNFPTSSRAIKCNSYEMNGYILGHAGNWTNSDKQREEMMSYEIKNIKSMESDLTIKNEFFWKTPNF
jgi:hypothetical protein